MDLIEALKKFKDSEGEDFLAQAEIDLSNFQPEYRKFSIKKPNGSYRKIAAPNEDTKEILRALNELMQEDWFVSQELLTDVYSFQRGKNTKMNAQHHVKKDVVLKLDLKDYFESITLDHLESAKLWPKSLEGFISRVCFLDGTLPQGAPTSPTIANWVVGGIILPIVYQALYNYKILNVDVTAYADDITLSGGKDLAEFYFDILDYVEKESGFKFNRKKSKWIKRNNKQEICGIVCNEKTNISKEKINQCRGLIHKSKVLSLVGDEDALIKNDQKIRGLYNYIVGIAPKKAQKIMEYRNKKYNEWNLNYLKAGS